MAPVKRTEAMLSRIGLTSKGSADWGDTLQIISLGEVLWDIFGEQELLGGAPLNISASLQRLGHSVALVSGVGMDERGDLALERMSELELSTEFVQRVSTYETGVAKVTVNAGGHATFVIPRPAAFDCLRTDEAILSRLESLHAQWLYFGTLSQMDESNLELLTKLFHHMPEIKGFYDINLRDGHWNTSLVQHLSNLASVLKLNGEEAELLFGVIYPTTPFSIEAFCRRWSTDHNLEMVCVTLGSEGCAVFTADTLHIFHGYKVHVADTVGAGDAFAAGFLHSLSTLWPLNRKAAFANALGALVASRAGATPAWAVAECHRLIDTSRVTDSSQVHLDTRDASFN